MPASLTLASLHENANEFVPLASLHENAHELLRYKVTPPAFSYDCSIFLSQKRKKDIAKSDIFFIPETPGVIFLSLQIW